MNRLIYAPEERAEKRKAKGKEWRERNREHMRAYMKKWRADHAEELRTYARENAHRYASRRATATRAYALQSKFGLSTEDFREMLVGQAGQCLICHRVPPTTLVVDHDHATGKIRGLLCNPCNRLLGIAADSPTRLKSAVRYLEMAS